METINELFSLLYAGHGERGMEQGWANLKQCRRLDACLGQTRMNSLVGSGEAQRVHQAVAQRGVAPEALGPPGSPCLSSRSAFPEDHRTNDTHQSRNQPSLPWKQGHGERDGLRHQHVLPIPVPGDGHSTCQVHSVLSTSMGWRMGVGERTSQPRQPKKGCEYYTVGRQRSHTCRRLRLFAGCGGEVQQGPLHSGWIRHVPEVYRGENTPGAVLGQQSTFIPKHIPRSHSISLSQGWYDLVLATNTEGRQRGLREDLLLSGSISGAHS